jgi:CO/xanthine dehydrogenase Mo-binding subunit
VAIDIPKSLDELPVSAPRFVGRAVPRVEDPGLVSGRTEFIDNVNVTGMVHCAILRSPIAHARIAKIDVSAAEELPGVVAVVTGADAERWCQPSPSVPEEWGTLCLPVTKVRFAGEPVAAVAATSRYRAEDALELIEVEYEPLETVMDPVKAMEPESPLVIEERGSNVMLQRLFTWNDVDAAFAEADHVFSEKFRWNRLGAKGCGEGAMHTTPAAVMCAVNDALAPLGVRANEVPAAPNRIWNLIREAREKSAGA